MKGSTHQISIPSVVIQRIDITVGFRLVDAAEDTLRPDQTPGGATVGRVDQRVVEPVLLAGAHHGAAGIVGDVVDVTRVPIQIGDRAVVVAGVQKNQVDQVANRE